MEKISFSPIVILIFFFIRFLLSRDRDTEGNADREASQEEAGSAHEQYEEEPNSDFENEDEPSSIGESKAKGLFAQCTTIEEVKKQFRRLSMLNHPDRGGNAAAMKEILAQYEEALKLHNRNK